MGNQKTPNPDYVTVRRDDLEDLLNYAATGHYESGHLLTEIRDRIVAALNAKPFPAPGRSGG